MPELWSHARRDEQNNIIAHTRLAVHLSDVASAAFEAASVYDTVKWAAMVAGLCHDFGKMTTYFQHYLRTLEVDPHQYQQHAYISALYGAFEAYRLPDMNPSDPLLVYLAIKHHHGNLGDLRSDVPPSPLSHGGPSGDEWVGRMDQVHHQITDLSEHRGEIISEMATAITLLSCPLPKGWNPNVEEFLCGGWRATFDRLYFEGRAHRRGRPNPIAYVRLLTIFSALIDSDKRKAAGLQSFERPEIPGNIVAAYAATITGKQAAHTKSNEYMDQVRRDLNQRAIDRIRRYGEANVFTLTAPTGSGKTLTALCVAEMFRESAKDKGQRIPRVIYALPFTSIVDQTFDILNQIYKNVPGFYTNQHRYLASHHHLSPVQATDDGRELPIDEALLLLEGWDSEFVVTTFIQLFDTIIGYRNAALKRFHRVENAIIILDEVQSLPAEWWPLVGNILANLSEQCGVKIILMTATQPQIPIEAVELAGERNDVATLFSSLDRVDMRIDMNGITMEDFIDNFLGNYDPSQSYMLVFNTIRASLDVYQRLTGLHEGTLKLGRQGAIRYLSSNVVPGDRRDRVSDLKKASEERRPNIIVCTQVIEAGVDIDVDVIYRELAPVDSLVQVSGRCNRNNGSQRGTVHVFKLEPTRGHKSSMEVVYKAIKSDATMHVLSGRVGNDRTAIIPESAFPQLVRGYFEKVADQEARGGSESIWKEMQRLHFSRPKKVKDAEHPVVCDFQLIEDRPQYVDLFVTSTQKAQELWEWYESQVLHERDLIKRRDTYLTGKTEFLKYVISVPEKRARSLGAVELAKVNFWYLPYVGSRRDIYDPESGLALGPEFIENQL